MAGQGLPVGQLLSGRYEIEKSLGQGGFGITYLAMDKKLLGRVAVKEYFPASLACRRGEEVEPLTEDCRQRFLRGREKFLAEAKTLAGLSQTPAIVSVLGCFEEKGTAYMVMEYVPGLSLRAWLEEQETLPSFQAVVELLAPVFSAMEQVHKKGLIHRDICPDNLIMRDNGTLTLIDFGAARAFFQQEEEALTRTVMVHQGYAPPEQYDKKGKQGPWTDVYGLAATLYEMLTGTMPPSALERLGGQGVYPASAYGVDITPEQEEALNRGLALETRERCSTVKAFRNALLPVEEQPDNKKKHWLWGAIVGVLVLALGVALWLCLAPKKEERVPLAGNYVRGSEEYTTFMEFVRENAVETKEDEDGTIYYLNEEAIRTWGVPANRYALEQTGDEVKEQLATLGLEEDTSDGWDIFWVREKAYGAISTRFDHVRVFRGENGVQAWVCADIISQQVNLVVVLDGTEDISGVLPLAAELSAWLNGGEATPQQIEEELTKAWEEESGNVRLKKLEIWFSQQEEGLGISMGRYGYLYRNSAPNYWPD